MDDIKVFNAGDLLKGVKLDFSGSPGQGSFAKDLPLPALGTKQGRGATTGENAPSPLEQVASSLAEAYAASDWIVPPGQANDWRFALAVSRAVLLAWYNPADTLPERLARVQALGRAFGMDQDFLEQVTAEALLANSHVVLQLHLQHMALMANTFCVREDSFPAEKEARAAYHTYRREAMAEAQQLMQQQLGLPEFNGLLRVRLEGAHGLMVKGRRKPLCPYGTVLLTDPRQQTVGRRQHTAVVTDSDSPTWGHDMETVVVPSADLELVIEVRSSADRARPMRSDPLVGKTGIRLAGLIPGLTQRMELAVYGKKDSKGPGCFGGCFGGGGGGGSAGAGGAQGGLDARPGDSQGQLDEAEAVRIIYDPSTNSVTNTQGRTVCGRVVVVVQYIAEKRDRSAGGMVAPEVTRLGRAGSTSRAQRDAPTAQQEGAMVRGRGGEGGPTPSDPSGTNMASAAAALRGALQGVATLLRTGSAINMHLPTNMQFVHRLDRHQLDESLVDPSVDHHVTFRKFATALYNLTRPNFGGGQLIKDVQDPGVPLNALGSFGEEIENAGLEAPLAAALAPVLGPSGLSLLFHFAKLYRVRPATQRIVLVYHLLVGAWQPDKVGYLILLKKLWHPIMLMNRGNQLTSLEMEGLAGLVGTFLQKACPVLASHYEKLTGREAVPCLVLLIEMTGWSLTWDPTRAAPIHVLAEHMLRAASARAAAIAALRPSNETLPNDVMAVAAAAQRAHEALQRDLLLQAELPGLRGLTRAAATVRYDALCDCLETLYMYRPGSTGAASAALWQLEERVLTLHDLMLGNGLGRAHDAPPPPAALGTQSSCGADTPTRQQAASDNPFRSPGGDESDSDVSPVSSTLSTPEKTPARRGTGYQPRPSPLSGRAAGGEGGRKTGGGGAVDEEDDDGGWEPLPLYDLEGAMTEALAQWAETGGEDLKRQVARLIERDPVWPPNTPAGGAAGGGAGGAGGPGAEQRTSARPARAQPSSGRTEVAASALELFRMLQVYVEVSCERALGGGPQRPSKMGPAIAAAVVACVRTYLQHCTKAWDEVLKHRALPPETAPVAGGGHGRAGHSRNLSDLFGGGAPAASAAGVPLLSPKKAGHRRSGTAADDLLNGGKVASASGTSPVPQGPSASPAAAAAISSLQAEPGLVLCSALLLVRNTVVAVADQVAQLEESLGALGPRVPLLQRLGGGGRGRGSGGGGAAGEVGVEGSHMELRRPAFLKRASSELRHALSAAALHCLATYRATLRDTLARTLRSAFDTTLGPSPPDSVKVLEGLLSSLHDELQALLAPGQGLRSEAVAGEVVLAVWGSTLGCVQALAQHQAGFRPLNEAEADLLREFLIGLQDMFGEVVDQHARPPHQRQEGAGCGLPPGLLDAEARARGTAYPSALLQCLAAATSDLQDMYTAQVRCLQQVDELDEDTLAGHQVTLLDLLRLLRQRRRTDPAAQTFVTEKLKTAASNVMQVLFGLRSSERLVASTSCILAPPVGGPAAAAAAAAAAVAAAGGSAGLVAAAATGGSSTPSVTAGPGREGTLYVTQRVLAYTTMLASDLRTTTDVTLKLQLKDVNIVRKGDTPDSLVVNTTGGEVHAFHGFGPSERDRICALLNGTAAMVPMPAAAPASAYNSPNHLAVDTSGANANGNRSGPSTPRTSGATGGLFGALFGGGKQAAEAPAATATASVAAAAVPSAAAAAAAGKAPGLPSSPNMDKSPSLLSWAAAKAATTLPASTNPQPPHQQRLSTAAATTTTAANPFAAAPPPAAPRASENVALPLLSTPCHLVATLRNKEGTLHLYASRLDFVCPSDPAAGRSVPLSAIDNVCQRPAGWTGGSVLVLTVDGDKAPLMFGGMGDALLASLKQNISELCFANG